MDIQGIEGLSVERVDGKRVVSYLGQECTLIKRMEVLCEADTSYNGCVLDSWETYSTPIGVVERHYSSWGAGLEHTSVDWRLIPVAEISAIQERFLAASVEMESARAALESVTIK